MAEGQLFAADHGSDGWAAHLLADDVFNPLDPASPIGFCSAAVRTADNTLFVAYSAKGGSGLGAGKVNVQDLSFTAPPRGTVCSPTPGSGAFIKLQLLGDGSVRVAQYNPREYKIYFETGDIPTENFVSLPAVQFDGPDEDCDGLDFWVDPAADASGDHDAVLVTLSSSKGLKETGRKKEYVGHITLMK